MNTAARLFLIVGLGLAAIPSAHATTVVEKDLDALCGEADRIFVGTVASVESRWADPEQRHIETWVTFNQIEPLFGVDTATVELRFAGGRIGDLIEQVHGLPEFVVGERAIVFARNGTYASPLVGFHQGYLRISGDGEAATVRSNTYQHVGTTAAGQSLLGEPRPATTMPLNGLLTDIRQRLARRRGDQP